MPFGEFDTADTYQGNNKGRDFALGMGASLLAMSAIGVGAWVFTPYMSAVAAATTGLTTLTSKYGATWDEETRAVFDRFFISGGQ